MTEGDKSEKLRKRIQSEFQRASAELRREQTAATLLAALTTNRMVADDGGLDDADRANVRYAVELTDALRQALRGGQP